MTEYRVCTWNLNLRSGIGKSIPKMVINELNQLDDDIICLTEYVKTENHSLFCTKLQDMGYEIFEDVRHIELGNEILIGIKSSLISDSNCITINNDDNHPNFLRVVVNISGKTLNIIGARIKTGGNDIITDFKERQLQLRNLVLNLPEKSENTIILGDFNNGYFKQDDDVFSYKGKAREFYSYPLLKSEMNKVGLKVYTPANKNSWKYCKLDHIIGNICVSNENYSWEFLNNPDYKNQVGYPDHAILRATISL
ncbi:TPA: endonuclease/exonuclease/phosphatase family protein [Streptococcus pneumoniae]